MWPNDSDIGILAGSMAMATFTTLESAADHSITLENCSEVSSMEFYHSTFNFNCIVMKKVEPQLQFMGMMGLGMNPRDYIYYMSQ